MYKQQAALLLSLLISVFNQFICWFLVWTSFGSSSGSKSQCIYRGHLTNGQQLPIQGQVRTTQTLNLIYAVSDTSGTCTVTQLLIGQTQSNLIKNLFLDTNDLFSQRYRKCWHNYYFRSDLHSGNPETITSSGCNYHN